MPKPFVKAAAANLCYNPSQHCTAITIFLHLFLLCLVAPTPALCLQVFYGLLGRGREVVCQDGVSIPKVINFSSTQAVDNVQKQKQRIEFSGERGVK